MVVILGRGDLTLYGQVYQLAPMVVAYLPKVTVRAIEAVDGPLAYLSIHRPPTGGTSGGSARPGTLRPKGQATREGSGLAQSARWSFGHDARSFMTLRAAASQPSGRTVGCVR